MIDFLAQNPWVLICTFMYFTGYCVERYMKQNSFEILEKYNNFLESEISKYKGRK